MSRQPKPWWNEKKAAWCTDLGGKRRVLAKGKRNKQQAETNLRAILAEQALLSSVGGAITVALLCEKFLADAHENLEFKTYRSVACCAAGRLKVTKNSPRLRGERV